MVDQTTKVTITFEGDEKSITKVFDRLDDAGESGGKKAGEKTGRSFGAGLSGGVSATIGSFTRKIALAGAAAGAALSAGLAKAVSEAGNIQTITTQFEVLTKSVNLGRKAVEELTDFTARTPFQFDQVARAGQQLLGFGFAADELVPRIQEIGDVAAAVGTPLTDLSLIFGQVQAAGKLTGERLLQLQQRAVPIGPALAKTLKVPESAIKDLVSKGKVSFAEFQKAFQSLSQEGGIAFGAIEKRSKTLQGAISTLIDNVNLTFAQFGKPLLPIIIPAINFLSQRLADLRKDIATNFSTEFLAGILRNIAGVIKSIAQFAPTIEFLFRVGAFVVQSFVSRIQVITKAALIFFNIFKDEINTTVGGVASLAGVLNNAFKKVFNFILKGILNVVGTIGAVLDTFNIDFGIDGLGEKVQDFAIETSQVLNDTIIKDGERFNALFEPSTLQEKFDGVVGIVEGAAEAITPVFEQINQAGESAISKTVDTVKKQTLNVTKTIESAFEKAISRSVQLMVKNLQEGKNAFAGFGQFLLGVLGDLAIQVGEVAIAFGVVLPAIEGLNAGASIAAGIALIAIGSILKGLSAGKGGLAGPGPAGDVGNGGFGSPGGIGSAGVGDADEEPATRENITINLNGVITDEDGRRRLVETINEASESDGAVFRDIRVV